MVLIVDDRFVLEGGRVDRNDGCGRVGTVLREGCPEDLAVILDSADMVLDVTRRRECCISNALALTVVHQYVGESSARRAVGAVDYDVLAERDRLLGPVAAPEDVPFFPDVDHPFRLTCVAFECDVLDPVPDSGSAEAVELCDDLLEVRCWAWCWKWSWYKRNPWLIYRDVGGQR